MLKAIIEVAIGAIVIVGSIAVVVVLYNAYNSAVYDPSLPHDSLWQMLFGGSR